MNRDPIQQASDSYSAGDIDQAAEICRAILVKEPSHCSINHLLGVIYFRQGKSSAARDLLERAIASSQATAEMHNNLGAVLRTLGETDRAADAFRRALALEPDYVWALNNLGVLYRDKGRTVEAIKAFTRACVVKPDFIEALVNLRSAYRDVVPPWHFAMMHDQQRNTAYEAAIRRAVAGKRVLDVGTGAGLLAMMAARAGAKSVVSCEKVELVADLARGIIADNQLGDRITVIGKRSDELELGRDIMERAEVFFTETFSSNLIDEGILRTIEDAHERLLAPGATIIPLAASAMGYLVGGKLLQDMLFVEDINGFHLGAFNAFAPAMLAVALDGLPHDVLSDDAELLRFDFKQRGFPMSSRLAALKVTKPGVSIGIAQWIQLELDAQTTYRNRPSRDGVNIHWSHLIYRFPKPVAVQAGDIVQVVVRHDRAEINIDLVNHRLG
jgi:tetratricopeptide (TPR) repeat protein